MYLLCVWVSPHVAEAVGLRRREGLESPRRLPRHPTRACPHPQLFAVGGFDGLRRLRSVERYDPFSNTWAAAAPLPEAVSSAAVVSCAGSIYVIGGAGQDGVSTNKVGQGAGGLLCAGRRAGTLTSSSAFRSSALRSDPLVSARK